MGAEDGLERCSCWRHAPTALRCARCDKPICPDCSRFGATGALCRSCALPSGIAEGPQGTRQLALAALAGGCAAALCGWLIEVLLGGWGFYRLWAGFGAGYLAASAMVFVARRATGTVLDWCAGLATGVGAMAGWLAAGGRPAGQQAIASALVTLAAVVIGAVMRARR